jgi:hypothetical protein
LVGDDLLIDAKQKRVDIKKIARPDMAPQLSVSMP